MPIGKQIGIGPAVRVFRHFIERQRFYQLKFPSGEQALVLVAGMPAPSVELVRLTLGGLLPWQTVWEYNPMFYSRVGRSRMLEHCSYSANGWPIARQTRLLITSREAGHRVQARLTRVGS